METFIEHAPIIGLLIFFGFFCGLLVWMLRPGMKKKLQQHAKIPLKEDQDGGQ